LHIEDLEIYFTKAAIDSVWRKEISFEIISRLVAAGEYYHVIIKDF